MPFLIQTRVDGTAFSCMLKPRPQTNGSSSHVLILSRRSQEGDTHIAQDQYFGGIPWDFIPELDGGDPSGNDFVGFDQNQPVQFPTNIHLQNIQDGLRTWTQHMPTPPSGTQSTMQGGDVSEEASSDDVRMNTDEDARNGTDGFESEATATDEDASIVCYGRVTLAPFKG
jgi:hypothetical protein